MKSISMIEAQSYFPKQKITNEMLEKQYGLKTGWIQQRSGIETRYQVEEETITELAIEVAKKITLDKDTKIGIFVATTSSDRLMPGISFEIQKALELSKAICMDVLCGCSGYINAFDVARKYLALGQIDEALVIGVEVLSNYLEEADINTSVLLADGAGAVLLKADEREKQYGIDLKSDGRQSEILTCHNYHKIYMDGKKIYKYAVCETVKSIQRLLKEQNERMENINYIIPHQSNLKIIKSIAERLEVPQEKMYTNLQKVGNTFCASIPIAIAEMKKENLLKEGNKIILLGYGGGLNLGSILMEV